MKSKFLASWLIIFMFFSMFIIVLTNTCNAEDGNYKISIKNKESKYLRTFEKGGYTFVYFDIIITLHNSGNIQSDNITIKIKDDEGNYTSAGKFIIKPGEDKTYIFNNHPFIGDFDHNLYIEYYPTEFNKRNKDNTGSTTLKVTNNDKNADSLKGVSSPGFELILLIIGIIILLFIIKNYRK